ncbi:TetR/AcrR family transcriptional regulator [Pseudonocardia phyllosphaerae]|uniref:TetR/AcrR family transcriptional regulator n=1 Tax=Pseudonocardia phyllosphaerae TaxID=3390502 RepID=UPI00397E0B6E
MRDDDRPSVLGAGPGQPRRRRLSDAETERRMLETAAEAVGETGLTVSLDHLRLEDVIRAAGVARSAVYRRWPSKGEFLGDLLLELAGGEAPLAATGVAEVGATIRGILAASLDELADGAARVRAVAEIVRVTAEDDFRLVSTSREWRTYLALTVTFVGMEAGELRDRIGEALSGSEARFVERIAANHAAVLGLLGLRRAAGPDGVVLAHLSNALVRGMVVKVLAQPELAGVRVRADLGGDDADWSLVAYGVARLLLGDLEPDPAVVWDEARGARLRAAIEAGADLPELVEAV